MRRVFAIAFLLCLLPVSAGAADAAIRRRDGFLLIWQSIRRPSQTTRERPFVDVPEGDEGFLEITYAKNRGVLDEPPDNVFRPADALQTTDAVMWLLRTRNVADPDDVNADTLPSFVTKYFPSLVMGEGSGAAVVTRGVPEAELLSLMRAFDEALQAEIHEVSLYGEKFHGKGTAFGETFDMNALTAAHRTFPQNTLVRVTNIDNGKSVVVRINDRGPYVDGRDMDLSVASFTSIADRSLGKFNATFQRLGDASLVGACEADGPRQQRITRNVRLLPGLPHRTVLGREIVLRANAPFVVRIIAFPDGTVSKIQDWVQPGEQFSLKPSLVGDYKFWLGTVNGRGRELRTTVWDCGAK